METVVQRMNARVEKRLVVERAQFVRYRRAVPRSSTSCRHE